jgi:hypothetical protein
MAESQGLTQALETYAASILHRQSVESILTTYGSLENWIQERLSNDKETYVNEEGDTITRIQADAENSASDYLDINEETGKLVEVKRKSGRLVGNFASDEFGNAGLIDGSLEGALPGFDSYEQFQRIEAGQQVYAEIKDSDGNVVLIVTPEEEGGYNYYDSYGDYVEAVIQTPETGLETTMHDGLVTGYKNGGFDFNFDFETGLTTIASSQGAQDIIEPILDEIAPPESETFLDKVKYWTATVGGLIKTPSFEETRPITELAEKVETDFGITRRNQVEEIINSFQAQHGFIPDVEITFDNRVGLDIDKLNISVTASSQSSLTFRGNMPDNMKGKLSINLATGMLDSANVSIKNQFGNFETTTYGSFSLDQFQSSNSFEDMFKIGTGASVTWEVSPELSSSESLSAQLSTNGQTGKIMRVFSYRHALTSGSASSAWKIDIGMDNDAPKVQKGLVFGAAAVLGILAVLSSLEGAKLNAAGAAVAYLFMLSTQEQSDPEGA